MPVRDWHRVVHAVKKSPTPSSYGQLKCGEMYVGRYSKRSWNIRKGVLLTVTVREQVTCLGCLAEEEA